VGVLRDHDLHDRQRLALTPVLIAGTEEQKKSSSLLREDLMYASLLPHGAGRGFGRGRIATTAKDGTATS
jgi:hypothetical protein